VTVHDDPKKRRTAAASTSYPPLPPPPPQQQRNNNVDPSTTLPHKPYAVNYTMPPNRNHELCTGFTQFEDPANFKGLRVRCNYCSTVFARHAGKERAHLLGCARFQQREPERCQRFKEDCQAVGDPTQAAGAAGGAAALESMPAALQKEMDYRGAMEVYMDTRPFTALTTPYMVRT
jgi:hypothetical protein